jgi:hypothetical protein
MQLTRQQAMTTALSLLAQYNEGKPTITLDAPGDWQLASHNTLLRWALRCIADDACQCGVEPADNGDLCSACFAKSMLEPMTTDRIQQIFNVQVPDDDDGITPGAVRVAGAVEDGPVFE